MRAFIYEICIRETVGYILQIYLVFASCIPCIASSGRVLTPRADGCGILVAVNFDYVFVIVVRGRLNYEIGWILFVVGDDLIIEFGVDALSCRWRIT